MVLVNELIFFLMHVGSGKCINSNKKPFSLPVPTISKANKSCCLVAAGEMRKDELLYLQHTIPQKSTNSFISLSEK